MAGAAELGGEEAVVEAEVVSGEHRAICVFEEVANHFVEAWRVNDVAGGDAMGLGGADVAFRVDERGPVG